MPLSENLISRTCMGNLTRAGSLTSFLMLASSSCATDTERVFLRYQRHLSKKLLRFWQLPCTVWDPAVHTIFGIGGLGD